MSTTNEIFYWAPSTKGFYSSEINTNIPDDAVELTKENYLYLANNQRADKVISVVDGDVVFTDRVYTAEERSETIRSDRNILLFELDQITGNPLRWATFTDAQRQQLAEYRQNLLDVPQQPTFPNSVVWPTKPQV
jgi:hypothetical protein